MAAMATLSSCMVWYCMVIGRVSWATTVAVSQCIKHSESQLSCSGNITIMCFTHHLLNVYICSRPEMFFH